MKTKILDKQITDVITDTDLEQEKLREDYSKIVRDGYNASESMVSDTFIAMDMSIIRPAKDEYIYFANYVNKNDPTCEIVFSKTFTQKDVDIIPSSNKLN